VYYQISETRGLAYGLVSTIKTCLIQIKYDGNGQLPMLGRLIRENNQVQVEDKMQMK